MLVAQSCPTLCNPMDYSSPGSPVHGILQAGILEWAATPFSRGSSWPRDWTWAILYHLSKFFTIWAPKGAWEVQSHQLYWGCFPTCFWTPWAWNKDTGPLYSIPWKWKESGSESCSVLSDSSWPHGLCSPWHSPGQKTGVGSLSLLQGVFPTQGLNWGLPTLQAILYHLSHKGSPRRLEWVAYPFSRRSSRPRNQTGVSCIAGGSFTDWAIREALSNVIVHFLVGLALC